MGNWIIVREEFVVKTVTLSIDDATNYGAGDQLGEVTALTNMVRDKGDAVELVHVQVFDNESTNSSIDIMIFNTAVTAAADNAAVAFSDADYLTKVGGVRVAEGDYVSGGNGTEASIGMIGQICETEPPSSDPADGSTSLWLSCRINEAANFADDQDIVIRLKFKRL